MRRLLAVTVVLSAACSPGASPPAPTTAVAAARIVDLTHPYDANTIYWPTDTTGFRLEELARGETDGGWFYSAYRFCTAEHGGTHMDAPVHFSAEGQSVDQVPLERLVGPAVVVDVSRQADADPDYRLTPEDLADHEAEHGTIPGDALVLLRTGWSQRWGNVRAYLGDDTPGDASRLSFPSFGEEAVRWLIDRRKVAVLGVDTASIDYGRSTDFMVHRVAAEHQIVGLENLTGLDELPPTGATVIALPMKIAGASGGPVRVIALLPD